MEVGYLGPDGSFASMLARKRYAGSALVSLASIPEVLEFTAGSDERKGIIPVENSSGGIIYDTIDALIADEAGLKIQEELGIAVKLAFLGRKDESIDAIYSHFAPIRHCHLWIRRNYPDARVQILSSTSESVRRASQEKNAAAIASRDSAGIYGLDVLEYPIEGGIPNVTNFFTLGHEDNRAGKDTSLIVQLKNQFGSLHEFLGPFARHGVNLKRIISRNVIGQPNTYVFFVGVEASLAEDKMQRAMAEAYDIAHSIRSLGSYPVLDPVSSDTLSV